MKKVFSISILIVSLMSHASEDPLPIPLKIENDKEAIQRLLQETICLRIRYPAIHQLRKAEKGLKKSLNLIKKKDQRERPSDDS